MVGGFVVNIIQRADRQTLEVRESTSKSRCCVDVPLGYLIEFGDSVWWQGGRVFWTPSGGSGIDRPIPKIGYSRPAEPI